MTLRKTTTVLAAAASAVLLAACGGDDETPANGYLRVAHLSPDAPAVDFCIAPDGTTAFTGPVVLTGATLGAFMNAGVIQTLASAASKFSKLSTWEIGKPVTRGEAAGDPLTVWANRRLPFGTHATRFDEEGLPAQRVALITDGRLVAFAASQRYADYLGLPATGAFGDIEVAPGRTPAADLLAEPHVEVVTFSFPAGLTTLALISFFWRICPG